MRKIYHILLLVLLGLSSCNSWLDIVPEDERVSSEYWNTKEDVANTTIASYVKMRACLLQMIQWGELRSNVLDLGIKAKEEEHEIRELNINSSNSIAQWKNFYQVINTANGVIKYAPSVVDKDPTFTDEMLNAYVAEATFMRSLTYFYLIRTFGDVPFITEPYITDDQEYAQPKMSEAAIVDSLINQLEHHIKYSLVEFSDDPKHEWQNKARGSRWAMLSLLADIYLWKGDYANVIQTCDRIISAGTFGLVKQEDWFKNYYPGNTFEIIFQLYYNQKIGQKNDIYSWFDKKDNIRYVLSPAYTSYFNDNLSDLRGVGASYFEEDGFFKIWKYIGTSAIVDGTVERRASNDRSPNWIIYRFSDILLMKAEALILQAEANSTNYKGAIALINRVRERAGAALLPEEMAETATEEELLKELIHERNVEFIAEGKTWFDLLRVGKRDNYKYKSLMIETILENVSIENRPILETKLSNPLSYYLPIHYDEVAASDGILEQNDFYR